MKPFEQTYFFKWVAPRLLGLLPEHPARWFWCLLLSSMFLVQLVNITCSFWNGYLDSPDDDTARYYCLLVVETIRYGGWLWGFWFGFYQLARLVPRNRLITPRLLSCSVTSGLLMYLLVMVAQTVKADYVLLIRGMLIVAFSAGVLLPTLWHPATNCEQ